MHNLVQLKLLTPAYVDICCALVLSHLQSSMEAAADRRREVEQLRQQLGVSEVAMQQQRGQVEAQLADVQPLIDAARTAVGGIKTDHINEVGGVELPSAGSLWFSHRPAINLLLRCCTLRLCCLYCFFG
eukprot:GHRR01023650.1.p1 GENE.GHRR01023650.1~~GHRR01023650.1.p1  ORF type:complete len:129 (+),score=36.88 GHRR01023650.1:596-982(+)